MEIPPYHTVKRSPNEYLRLIWEELSKWNTANGLQGSLSRWDNSADNLSSLLSMGAPIAGASKILAAPQYGDTTDGIIDGIWHPALGQLFFSDDPDAVNGIPANAQSVQIITRIPLWLLNSDSDEAWRLKHIAAYARLDGERPEFSSDGGIRHFPIGGAYAKTWVSVAQALTLMVESRWLPPTDAIPPYQNYRLIAEIVFYEQPIRFPHFEPSLLLNYFSTSGTQASGTLTPSTSPIVTTDSNQPVVLGVQLRNEYGSPLENQLVEFRIQYGEGDLTPDVRTQASGTLTPQGSSIVTTDSKQPIVLEVQLRNESGSPFANRPVEFRIQDGEGDLT